MAEAREIREDSGKLGVLTQGMGAVATTTYFAGVELAKTPSTTSSSSR